MNQKQKLQISALELSDRLKTYRSRPVSRVKPRSHVNHLQKRVGMDVWEPASQTLPIASSTELVSEISYDKPLYIKQASLQTSKRVSVMPRQLKQPISSFNQTDNIQRSSSSKHNDEPLLDLRKTSYFQGSCRTSDKAVLSDRDVAVATSKEEKLVNPGLVKSEDARILRKSSLHDLRKISHSSGCTQVDLKYVKLEGKVSVDTLKEEKHISDSLAKSEGAGFYRKSSLLPKLDFTLSAKEWKQSKKAHRSFKKSKLANYSLYAMATFVFLFGVAAGLRSFMIDHQIAQTVSAQATGVSEDPEESKPSDDEIRSYSVAPDMPRIITIPKLRVTARVKQISVKTDGSLDAPKNIHDAGWYKDSAKPSSPGGASLIDGHVSGPTQKGVFYKIETLQNGDTVNIERGDGKIIEYKVKKVEVKKATEVDMGQLLISITRGKHGLNLITCTGKFDSKTKTYEDRALVYAEVVNNN